MTPLSFCAEAFVIAIRTNDLCASAHLLTRLLLPPLASVSNPQKQVSNPQDDSRHHPIFYSAYPRRHSQLERSRGASRSARLLSSGELLLAHLHHRRNLIDYRLSFHRKQRNLSCLPKHSVSFVIPLTFRSNFSYPSDGADLLLPDRLLLLMGGRPNSS